MPDLPQDGARPEEHVSEAARMRFGVDKVRLSQSLAWSTPSTSVKGEPDGPGLRDPAGSVLRFHYRDNAEYTSTAIDQHERRPADLRRTHSSRCVVRGTLYRPRAPGPEDLFPKANVDRIVSIVNRPGGTSREPAHELDESSA